MEGLGSAAMGPEFMGGGGGGGRGTLKRAQAVGLGNFRIRGRAQVVSFEGLGLRV